MKQIEGGGCLSVGSSRSRPWSIWTRNPVQVGDLGGDRGALGQGSGDSTTGRGGKEATSEGVFKLAATVGRWNLILLGDTGWPARTHAPEPPLLRSPGPLGAALASRLCLGAEQQWQTVGRWNMCGNMQRAGSGETSVCYSFLFPVVLFSRSGMSNSSATPLDCSPPGSSVPGIFQARILEWVAMPSSRGISPTQGSNPSLLHCRWILHCWATWEAPLFLLVLLKKCSEWLKSHGRLSDILLGTLPLFLHQGAQCYTRPAGDTPSSPTSRQAEGLGLRRWLVLVRPVVCFWWMWFRVVENMACPAIRAKALAPSKLSCQQPAPVLDLLNMFPGQGTKDQMRLVTLEGKPAVCIPRGLGLSSFPPSQPLHPLSTGSTQLLNTLQRPKKDCRVPNVQFMAWKHLAEETITKSTPPCPSCVVM